MTASQQLTQLAGDPYTPTQPEGENEGIAGPGQSAALDAFLKEQGVQPGLNEEDEDQGEQGEELLAGKFKSKEDLAKAYKELERKLGQQGKKDESKDQDDEDEDQGEQPEATDPSSYTKELGTERYGEAMADLFEQAEFNPLEIEAKIESGELQLEAAAKQMAEALPFSEQVITTYLNGLYEVVDDGKAPEGLSQEAEAEVREAVGGDKAFTQLVGWAKENLDRSDLEAYNAAVATGDRNVALIAAKFLQASAQAMNAIPRVEPKLVSGRSPGPSPVKFESRAQAIEAMNKLNTKGQRLYDVDEAYRTKVAEMVGRSDF